MGPIRSVCIEHPVCQFSAAHRVFNVIARLALSTASTLYIHAAIKSSFPSLFLISFIRIAESNHLRTRRNIILRIYSLCTCRADLPTRIESKRPLKLAAATRTFIKVETNYEPGTTLINGKNLRKKLE
jgi:hypothetical protein